MKWIEKILELILALLGIWKQKAEEKREKDAEQKEILQSEEYKERVKKNEETIRRDKAEEVVAAVKAAQNEEERQAALEELRKRVSK